MSFGEVSQILRGNISLGYGRQTPDSRELEVIDGLLIDADLTWQVTPLTTLQFTAASEVAETTTVDFGGVMERVYGLEGRQSFTTYLVGIAGIGYMTRDFVGAGITENQFTAAVGAEYYLNRWAVLFTPLPAHRLRQLAARQQLHRRRGAGRRAPAPLIL